MNVGVPSRGPVFGTIPSDSGAGDVVYTLRLPPPLAAKLREQARDWGVSVNAYIKMKLATEIGGTNNGN